MTGTAPNAEQRANLMAYLRYCEAHPDLWAQPGAIAIPLDQVGLTYDEMVELFEQPTLAEVRRAVEEFLAEDDAQRWADEHQSTGTATETCQACQGKGYTCGEPCSDCLCSGELPAPSGDASGEGGG